MRIVRMYLDYWNRQIKKFTIIDVKIAECSAAAFVLILIKLFPKIMDIPIGWFIAVLLLCMARLWYVVLFKKES